MPARHRPTEHVRQLVRSHRLRIVLVLQAILLLGACALVWGALSDSSPTWAYLIIGGLVVAEGLLLVKFLREPPEGDEAEVTPILDTPEEFRLYDLTGGTITVDKVAQQIRARGDSVCVPLREIQTILVDQGTDAHLMVATTADLFVLSELRDCTDGDRARLTATGRLLARVAAVPFGDED